MKLKLFSNAVWAEVVTRRVSDNECCYFFFLFFFQNVVGSETRRVTNHKQVKNRQTLHNVCNCWVTP